MSRLLTLTAMARWLLRLPPPRPDFSRYSHDQQLGAFMEAIAAGEGGYDSFRADNGAMGHWQILPGNWKAWAHKYLGDPLVETFADRFTPPAQWKPATTPANQQAIVRGRMEDFYTHKSAKFPAREVWVRIAPDWAIGPGAGDADFKSWSRHAYLYGTNAMRAMRLLLP